MIDCLFCKTRLVKDRDGALIRHCTQCYSKFLFSGMDDNKMIGYMLVAKYGEQYYGAVFHILPKHFMLEKLEIDKKTGKAFYLNKEPLLQLSYLPNITPENFAKKLATLLIFS